MTAISQLFMPYNVSESSCAFNGEYHKYIKNVQNWKNTQVHFVQKLLKNDFFNRGSARIVWFRFEKMIQQKGIIKNKN